MAIYGQVQTKYKNAKNAPDPWNIVNFGVTLSTVKFLNEAYKATGGKITPAAVQRRRSRSRARRRSARRRWPAGKIASSPAVCNQRAQFFTYNGKGFTKAASWLQPPGAPLADRPAR